jgi:hypothetical protein
MAPKAQRFQLEQIPAFPCRSTTLGDLSICDTTNPRGWLRDSDEAATPLTRSISTPTPESLR